MKSSDGSTYTKLVDITEFPDLGGSPEQIDVTTLSDMERHYINGIEETEALTFRANYTSADFTTLKAESGDTYYAVWFGGSDASTPTGSLGKFAFKGELHVHVDGHGVNEAQSMTIVIAPSTKITFSVPTP